MPTQALDGELLVGISDLHIQAILRAHVAQLLLDTSELSASTEAPAFIHPLGPDPQLGMGSA